MHIDVSMVLVKCKIGRNFELYYFRYNGMVRDLIAK